MKIADIEKKLKKAEQTYKEWLCAKAVYDRIMATDLLTLDETTLVFAYYIRDGSVTDAAKSMNERGFRIGNRKYSSNDISATIDSGDIADIELKEVARWLLRDGRYLMDMIHN